MKASLTPITAAVAALLLASGAQAQEKQQQLDTVVVTGIRASLAKSLETKRNAESRVEVITAEDIGKMPDKNVADSLQRVPGVTISSASANEGGFDENDRVSLRGTNPSLTQTLVNGHSISSGDWFVLNQTGSVGRSVSYSLLPSQLVSQVLVHKSPEAYLVEGGTAGAVNIITRKPLQFRNAFTAEAQLGAVYADLPGKTDPQISALINWKNADNSLGAMLQIFREHRHLRRDGQELLGYAQIKPGSAIATSNPDLANVWYPVLIGSALFEQKREREGGLLSVQLKPTKDLDLTLNAFSSKMEAANYNRNYMLWGANILQEGAGQAPQPGYVVRNGTLVSASFAPVAGRVYGVYDQISRPNASSESNFVSLDARWDVSDDLTLTAKAGTTRGNGKTPTQDVAEWNTGVGTGAGWQLNGIGEAASWNLGTQNNASPTGLGLGWIFGDQNINVKDKENWAQLDGELQTTGLFKSLKFGARATDHSRANRGVIGQGPGCKTSSGANVGFDWSQQYWCPVGTQSAADPANFPQGSQLYPGDFGAGLGGSFPRNVWYYTADQLAVYNARFANRSTDGSRQNWNSEYGMEEQTQAAYLQGDFASGTMSGNLGLRLVRTQFDVTNNVAVSGTTPGAITTSAFGPYLPVTTSNSYTDVLPSLNMKFKVAADQVLRLSAAKVMSRPDYSALAGSVALSPPATSGQLGSGSGGNPDLKPVRSSNLDATWEFYYAPRALFSAGLFHMNLSSYVGFGRVDKQFMTYSSASPQGVLETYRLTVPVNTGGKVNGIELAWEQPLHGGFGLGVNYTYTDAKDDAGGPLVGASKNTYNFVFYYEDDRFNARLAYNARSAFYSGLDRNTAFWQDASKNLAASLGYKISDNLSLSLDGHNLNNPKLKYYALNKDQPRSVYENGRQFYLTLRAKL